MANQTSIKEEDLRKGPWYEEEDERLTAIVALLGERRWDALAKASGLKRSGKSCRLRWKNYLRPNLKHDQISTEEEEIILQLHQQWGNKWSKIARRLPGRTDNEIKNYWRCHLRKKTLVLEQGNTLCKSEPELLNPKCDTDMLTLGTSNGEDNISGVSIDSCDSSLELSNFSSPHSPYGARLSDWFSYWSYEQSEIKHHWDSCSLDSCLCYPVWISENSDVNIWNSSDSIWDLA